MERKTTELDIRVPHLTREIIKLNKVGKTDVVLEHVHKHGYMSIDNFNCPYRLMSRQDQSARRYVGDKFTESANEREMNVIPGLEYVSNENSNTTLHLEVIGIKRTNDNNSKIKEYENNGYNRFNISGLIERYPDGHGEFENIDYIYDENGNYIKGREGEKWSYRYDSYVYLYKLI